MKRLYLISYDIPVTPRRTRVAKALLGYGERVQRSVFECWLDEAQLADLQRRMDRLIKPDEDSVRYYRLGAAGQVHVVVQGLGVLPAETAVYVC